MNRLIAIAAVAVLATGCGSAHLVRGDAHGGEIALSGSYAASVTDAQTVMTVHCDGPFTVEAPAAETSRVPRRGHERFAFACDGAGGETAPMASPAVAEVPEVTAPARPSLAQRLTAPTP